MSTDRVAAPPVVAAPRPFVRWLRRARRSPALVAGAFLLTFMVAISVLVSLLPAWNASRVSVRDAISYE